MKDGKQDKVGNVIEDYLRLFDEKIDLSIAIARAIEASKKKLELKSEMLRGKDVQELFTQHCQINKCKQRQKEVESELDEVETSLKRFLTFLDGKQIVYEKKVKGDKQKAKYILLLREGKVHCNKQAADNKIMVN